MDKIRYESPEVRALQSLKHPIFKDARKELFYASYSKSTTPRIPGKSKQYYELGKLGPNIGTFDWTEKKHRLDQRVLYAHQVQRANTKLIKIQTPIEEVKMYTLRDKALDFAKTIPKPSPKKLEKLALFPNQTLNFGNDLIADLDCKHQAYKKSVEEIRRSFFKS